MGLQCCRLPARELDSDYLRGVAKHALACSDVVGIAGNADSMGGW